MQGHLLIPPGSLGAAPYSRYQELVFVFKFFLVEQIEEPFEPDEPEQNFPTDYDYGVAYVRGGVDGRRGCFGELSLYHGEILLYHKM